MVSNIHHLYYYSYSNNYFPGINDFLNSSNGLEKIESSVKKRSSSAKGILIFDYYYLILNFFFPDSQANYDQEREALSKLSDTITEKYSSFMTEVNNNVLILISILY